MVIENGQMLLTFDEVVSIYSSGKGIIVYLKEIDKFYPKIEFEFWEGKLRIGYIIEGYKTGVNLPESASEALRGAYTYVDEVSKNYIEVLTDPFEINIRDFMGNLLIRFFTNTRITFLLDYQNDVGSMSLSFYTDSTCFYGFGERFNKLNQAGGQTEIKVIEKFGSQNEATYMPIPFFLTDKNYGIYTNSTMQTRFTLPPNTNNILIIETGVNLLAPQMELEMFFGEPKSIIKQFMCKTGHPKLPPKWAFGPWMSSNGWSTQKEVEEQIEMMCKYEIPASVIVIEAWSDEATFYIFNEANYEIKGGADSFKYDEFEFRSEGKWPDPKAMINNIHKNNLKVILWQIPVIKHFEVAQNEQHSNDEKYVIEHKLCVQNPDGTPYRMPDVWFAHSLVHDFTNPEAKKWWFKKRQYLLDDLNVDGFKTDGGEFIYDDKTSFYNGKSGAEMRNPYPVSYISAYHEFIGQDRITFSRAGFTGAQKYPMYWAGDQYSTFKQFKNVIIAGLSINISGNPFWGFDIAGFAGDMPSAELYIRSSQVAVFSPIMQFHSEGRQGYNNDRSPWNVSEYLNDYSIIEIYRKFANLRMNLIPYIYNEAINISKNCEPFMRPLFVDFPLDKNSYFIDDEYMFGRSLLIAPITEENTTNRRVYLPEGEWIDFFYGKKYTGESYLEYPCELSSIPVFIKNNSILPMNLNNNFEVCGNIGNNIDGYENLCFAVFGDAFGIAEFYESIDYSICISKFSRGIEIEGHSVYKKKVFILLEGDNYNGQKGKQILFNNFRLYLYEFTC